MQPVIEGMLLLYWAKIDPIKAITDRDYYENLSDDQRGRIKRVSLNREGDIAAIDFVDDVTILREIGMISAARQVAARKEKTVRKGMPLDIHTKAKANSHGTKPMGRG